MVEFIGEIRMFAGNYIPEGWLSCNGQELPVQGNESLYSI
ncbi:MAG: tail fiber protein, partial [Saprospiraceae bacterium]|nr:tail fiber protein [Saprospiraceae bacterium]